MSKTFKTDPLDVQMAGKNPKMSSEEVHDHRNGECDLPNIQDHVHERFSTRCHWVYRYEGRNFSCGCSMCTRSFYRKEDRRRDRHIAKTALRKATQGDMTKAVDL